MIELIVLDYLKSKLNIPVVMEEIDADDYILIEKVGSSYSNGISSSTFAIQSYSTSLYKAAFTNAVIKDLMLGADGQGAGIIEVDDISNCSLNSDYNYTDIEKKHYRYQAIYNLIHY